MNHKSSIWFDGREYRWNDKHNDYTLVADGETKYREAKRLRYKNDLCKTLIRYAAQGAQGVQGIQGIQGVSGISGTKPSIWYRGYEYEWDEKTNEYVRWVRKGKGPATPFTLKEAVGNDLKKYDSLIKKSQTKKATAKPKKAKKPEPPKFDFTKLAYKGFTASDKDLKKFKDSLKKLDEKELEEAKNEIIQYVSDFRQKNNLSLFDEESGDFGKTFRQAIREELDSRKPKEQIVYPTLEIEGCKSIDEYKKYLATLKSDDDVAKQKKKILEWGNSSLMNWATKYGQKLDLGDYFDSKAKCQKIVGDTITELLKAFNEELKGRREEAMRRRKEELEQRRKLSATPKKRVKSYTPDVSYFPETFSNIEVVNPKIGGSTGAKMVKDENGRLYVMKYGNSPEHIVNEARSDAFYQAAGVKVPGFKLYNDENGTPVKLATMLDNTKKLNEWWDEASDKEREEMKKKIRKDFAVDVLMGNWDFIGDWDKNILVDSEGNPWRIDNGCSMRFRGSGALKEQWQWDKSFDELFTMTGNSESIGSDIHSTIQEWLGVIRPLDVAKEINSRDWSKALATLSEEDRLVVENRIEEARQLAERGDDNEKFGRTKESTDRIIAFSYQMCKDGIREALPTSVDLTPNNLSDWKKESGWLSSGNTTATLGGKDYGSFGEYLADKMGADAFNAVQTVNEKQGNGSYEDISVQRKLCILKSQGIDCLDYDNVEDFLKDAEDAGYYCAYHNNDTDEHRKSYLTAFQNYQANPDQFKSDCKAVEQFDAAIQLILENVQMENVDPVTRTVILGRTERMDILKSDPNSSDKPNEGERTYHNTGVCESHSRVQYGCVAGYGLTVVRVPFSRIHGLWMIERGLVTDNGYEPQGEGQFCDSAENEIIGDTHGLIIIFFEDLKPNYGYSSGKQHYWDAKPYVDKFLQWEKDNPDQVVTERSNDK